MVQHGMRACYDTGCRCEECRLAESMYQRGRRRRGIKPPNYSQQRAPAPPVTIPVEATGPGRVEAAVLVEIEGLSTASARPGLVEGALAMARLLDSPLSMPQHPPAMARLQNVLAELRVGADSRKGWLAEVRNLTPPASGNAAG
jgi:hypothetical protein